MVILGIVLVLAGAGLMVAEAHLPTAGILGLLGVVSLVAGGAIAVDASGGGVALVVVVTLLLALIAGVTLAAVVRGARSVPCGREDRGRGPRRPRGGCARNWSPSGRCSSTAHSGARDRARSRSRRLPRGRPGGRRTVKGLTLSVRRAEEWELDHDRRPRRLIVVIAVVLVVARAPSVRILREYERAVVFRLGRLLGSKGPGSSS